MKSFKGRRSMAKVLSAVILIVGVFFLGTAHAANLPINNPSFESPAQGPGVYTYVAPTGWTLTGSGGVWNPGPSPSIYFTMAVPNAGNQVLFLNGGAVSQTLSSVLTAGATYTLDVDVGHRLDGYFVPSTIELLAGSNILVSGGSSFDPGIGNFGTLALTYTAAAGNPYLGESLGITIFNSGVQSDFTNVRLSATPVPPSLLLLAPGLLGLAGLRKRFKL